VWRQGLEFVRAIRRTPLAPGERAACYAEMVRWAGRHYKSLGKDVVLALPQAARAVRGAAGAPHPSRQRPDRLTAPPRRADEQHGSDGIVRSP
jgi:hypothetical protein